MFHLLLFISLYVLAFATRGGNGQGVVTYNWDVTWVNASPNGVSRPFIGINGQWPCPPIEVNIGDRVSLTCVIFRW